MATYNGAKFLKQQLESIFSQTLPPDEVIICDDNSNDATVLIINEFITSNNCLNWHIFKNKENLGYPGNFYYCLSKCTGDIIFLSDQDDLWKLNKVEKMSQIMSNYPKINLLSCLYNAIDENNNLLRGLMIPNEKYFLKQKIFNVKLDKILKSYRWPGMTMVLRKKWLDTFLPAISTSKVPHDLLLGLLAADTNSFYQYNYLGVNHRRHTSNTAEEEHAIFKLLAKDNLKYINIRYSNLNNVYMSKFLFSNISQVVILEYINMTRYRHELLERKSFILLIRYYVKYFKCLCFKSFIRDLFCILFK